MKQLLWAFFLIGSSYASPAQIAISYYPITSYLGVSTNTNRYCWVDLRFQTNTFIGFTNIEVSPKLNLRNSETLKIYLGTGVNLNFAQGAYSGQYINGYFISSGVITWPFKELQNLGLGFEISPYINYGLSDGIIRTTLGITWQFKKKSKKSIVSGKDS